MASSALDLVAKELIVSSASVYLDSVAVQCTSQVSSKFHKAAFLLQISSRYRQLLQAYISILEKENHVEQAQTISVSLASWHLLEISFLQHSSHLRGLFIDWLLEYFSSATDPAHINKLLNNFRSYGSSMSPATISEIWQLLVKSIVHGDLNQASTFLEILSIPLQLPKLALVANILKNYPGNLKDASNLSDLSSWHDSLLQVIRDHSLLGMNGTFDAVLKILSGDTSEGFSMLSYLTLGENFGTWYFHCLCGLLYGHSAISIESLNSRKGILKVLEESMKLGSGLSSSLEAHGLLLESADTPLSPSFINCSFLSALSGDMAPSLAVMKRSPCKWAAPFMADLLWQTNPSFSLPVVVKSGPYAKTPLRAYLLVSYAVSLATADPAMWRVAASIVLSASPETSAKVAAITTASDADIELALLSGSFEHAHLVSQSILMRSAKEFILLSDSADASELALFEELTEASSFAQRVGWEAVQKDLSHLALCHFLGVSLEAPTTQVRPTLSIQQLQNAFAWAYHHPSEENSAFLARGLLTRISPLISDALEAAAKPSEEFWFQSFLLKADTYLQVLVSHGHQGSVHSQTVDRVCQSQPLLLVLQAFCGFIKALSGAAKIAAENILSTEFEPGTGLLEASLTLMNEFKKAAFHLQGLLLLFLKCKDENSSFLDEICDLSALVIQFAVAGGMFVVGIRQYPESSLSSVLTPDQSYLLVKWVKHIQVQILVKRADSIMVYSSLAELIRKVASY
jgi:Nup85 Nucleoporin